MMDSCRRKLSLLKKLGCLKEHPSMLNHIKWKILSYLRRIYKLLHIFILIKSESLCIYATASMTCVTRSNDGLNTHSRSSEIGGRLMKSKSLVDFFMLSPCPFHLPTWTTPGDSTLTTSSSLETFIGVK